MWPPSDDLQFLPPYSRTNRMTTMSTGEELPLRARWGTAAIFFANGFGIGSWAAAIAPLKTTLSLSDAELSAALLSMAASAILIMPFAGLLAPRLGGTGQVLRYSSVLFGVSLCLSGLAQNLPMLIGFVFLLGGANGLMDVPMNAHATVVERGWGAAIMSSFHAAWSFGGLVGAALGGLLIHAGASAPWQLAIAGAFVLIIVLPATQRIGIGELSDKGSAFTWPERRLIGLCVVALLAMLVEGAMTDWSAVYLTSVVNLTAASAAGGYAAYACAMLLGRAFGDKAVRALGRTQIMALGAAISATGILLTVATTSPAVAISGFCLVGLGLSNMIPAVFSASGAMGSSPALGISMTATIGYGGFLLGPPAIGAIASYGGLHLAFVLLILVLLAIIPLVALNRQSKTGAA
jgi:MFS family permease